MKVNQSQFLKPQVDNNKKNQNFSGSGAILNAATTGLKAMADNPILEVAFADVVVIDAPRVITEYKTTGVAAAAEAFRREFSGLIVNCLLPSFVVLGISKLIGKSIMGDEFKNIDMSASWANGETLDNFVENFKEVINPENKKTSREEITKFVKNSLGKIEGLNGNQWVDYSKSLDNEAGAQAVEIITNLIVDKPKDKKTLKKSLARASELITSNTGAAETLRLKNGKKALSSNLGEILRDQVDVGSKFLDDAVRANLDGFKKNATKLVNTKSIAGLAIILPLAASMQYINRAITRHKYNKKGAPIYKDFESAQTHQEMTPEQKNKFFGKKLLSSGAMLSLALLSMMKKPTLGMFQFKGMFPSIDQCRWIAATTNISRLFAAEDENELRESTIRDMTSFSGLYFLGDYASKAAATLLQKKNPDKVLLNKSYVANEGDSIFKKVGNWVKRTSVKSFDEVKPSVQNLRSICQLSSLGFSMLTLGIILPMLTRAITNKKVEQAKQQKLQEQAIVQLQTSNLSQMLANDDNLKAGGVFSAFSNVYQ